MAAPVQLKPLLCVRCQAPIEAALNEVAWVCPQCGQGQALFKGETLDSIQFHFSASIQPGQRGKPYWVAEGTVQVARRIYGGGDRTKEAQQFWAGTRKFFVPAFACPLDTLVETGTRMLLQPPPLVEGSPAAFEPVTSAMEDMRPLAEFIVMGVEAARKDNLKEVQFQLELGLPELWVLG